MTPRKANFKRGLQVQERAKPRRIGVILQASQTDQQKHHWSVEFVQEDGTKVTEIKSSRQLLHHAPEQQEEQQPNATMNIQVPLVIVEETVTASVEAASDEEDEEIALDEDEVAPAAAEEAAPDEAEVVKDDDEESVYSVDNDNSHVEPNPNEAPQEEDNPDQPTEDVDPREKDDLETEEEHARKRAEYLQQKAKLLQDGWTVVKETEKPPLHVGARVSSRSKKNPKEGLIVGQLEDKSKWIVLYDGYEETEEKSHQSLIQIFETIKYEWTLVEHSDPTDPRAYVMDHEYEDIGVTQFNFEQFRADRVSKTMEGYQYPYLKLLQKLWPGDWKFQLKQLNQHVDVHNANQKRKLKKKAKVVRKITMREWWVFIGLLLVAAAHGLGGGQLWETARDVWTASDPINYGPSGKDVMSHNRFREIQGVFPYAFQDKKAEDDDDPWHMIRGILNGYNLIRSLWVASSIKKVLDESMSAWSPRTTKTGGLPNISYIKRKPEPLGTEFKSVDCSKTGIMLYLEVQEGATVMQTKKYTDSYGATASCTFRLTESTAYTGSKWKSRKDAKEDEKPQLFIGDSWFTSVPVVERLCEQGHLYIGAMKTSSRLFPKEELEKKMEHYSSGSSLVMECTTPNGHSLVAIGYKYNKRKVLLFLANKDAGSTRPGKPYIAKFPDTVGNVCTREVERPALISEYFSQSNVVDTHNHVRQGELKLEKRWVTHDCWFRLATTLISMTVTDCWQAFRHHVGGSQAKDKEIGIVHFTDRLAADCIRNTYPDIYVEEKEVLNLTTAPMLSVDVVHGKRMEKEQTTCLRLPLSVPCKTLMRLIRRL